MAPVLYLLFNHELTSVQEEDARKILKVERIADPPEDLKAMWRQIPPDLEKIAGYLAPVMTWLKAVAKKGDYLLVQGDFGACYIVVSFAFNQGLVPVYSTTVREALEEHRGDGTVKIMHRFRHRTFRRYGQ